MKRPIGISDADYAAKLEAVAERDPEKCPKCPHPHDWKLEKSHDIRTCNACGADYDDMNAELRAKDTEKRLDACTCPHHEKAPHLTSCRCCSGKVNDS